MGKQTKYDENREFQEGWLQKFTWLAKGDSKKEARCKVCRAMLAADITTLKRHELGKKQRPSEGPVC